ncbi:hypothetical protein DXG01_015080 [Tephrocybe rancida]|nr:hypothetical protein DXG01_015080 [Tephrocybe rancida]
MEEPLADMGVSPPPDPIMDIVGGGSGVGPTDLGVDALRELVAQQAAILETFKEELHKEREALGHKLREAQLALYSQAREHFQDALEGLGLTVIRDVQTSSWCFSHHINTLHTGCFVIPSDAKLFVSLFDYGNRDDLDQVMSAQEAAEYFEEHHGDLGRVLRLHSPGSHEHYWEEGEQPRPQLVATDAPNVPTATTTGRDRSLAVAE